MVLLLFKKHCRERIEGGKRKERKGEGGQRMYRRKEREGGSTEGGREGRRGRKRGRKKKGRELEGRTLKSARENESLTEI